MNNIRTKITVTLIIAASLFSCNNIPSDLQAKKENLNKRYTELNVKSEKILGEEEINKLIIEYQELKKDAVSIISEFDSRKVKDINKNVLNDIDEKINTLRQSLPISISYTQAEVFMQNRCNEIGQTLMRSKTVNFNGTKLYMFLSVAENGYVCISSVSENALEVLAADCGPSEVKIEQWNAVN